MRDRLLQATLGGYAEFLRERDLALPKHQSYLVCWVREFLLFARGHGGYTFEQTLDMFLAELGGRAGVKPWQIQGTDGSWNTGAVRDARVRRQPGTPRRF